MKEQVLKIMELCLKLKEEKGYDVFFDWHPHCNLVEIRHSETYKWDRNRDNHHYWERVYIDQPRADKKLSKIINHLEAL